MRWPQFSLITLAGFVAFSAVACSALIYASAVWAASILTAAVVFLMFAITAAIYRDGGSRAFWLGASIWGGAYLWLTFPLLTGRQQTDTFGRNMSAPDLSTTQVSVWVYQNVLPKLRTPPPPSGGFGAGGFMFGTGVNSDAGMSGNVTFPEGMGGAALPVPAPSSFYPDQESFLRVSHALWLWLFAFAGGVVGRWLYTTRNGPAPLRIGSSG